ncbi:hypothetical protein M2273_001958 [Mucilaginibacter lappiensis]
MLHLNLQTRLLKIFVLVVCILSMQQRLSAATFDWTGTGTCTGTFCSGGYTNFNSWINPDNWTVNGLPTSAYPGQGGNTDIVRIGVNVSYTVASRFPIIAVGTTITCASVTFGPKNTTTATGTTIRSNMLTVNGILTATTIKLSPNTNTSNIAGNNYIEGTGTINCTNMVVGDNSTTTGGNNYLFSHVSTMNVSGDVTVVISTSVVNGSGFRLETGTMNLNGKIFITNPNNVTASTNLGYFTVNAKYSTNVPATSSTNPVLNLSAADPVGSISSPRGSINFYGDHGGNAEVHYLANNPKIYTSSTPGFGGGGGVGSYLTNDTTSATYDDLYINGSSASASTATIGTTTKGPLKIDGNISITNTTANYGTGGTITTVAGNWTNTASTVNLGFGAVVVGVDFTNDATSSFNQANGRITINGNVSNSGALILGSGLTDLNGNVTTGGTLQMSSGALNIAKNYTNTGTFTASTGLITFDGAVAQTLIDNTAAGTKFNNVTFSNGSSTITKRMKSGSNFFVNPTYTLNAINSGTLTVENTPSTYTSALTLLSTAAGDASIGNLTAGNIAGKIEVQRYIKGGARRYMLLSSPVADTTSTAINISASSPNGYSLKPIILPGAAGNKLSTIVTGPGGSTNGFDSAPATGNSPSVFVYNENAPSTADPNQVAGNEYKAFTNTSAAIPMGNGILLYFRGSRDLLNSTPGAPFVRPFPAADDATLTFFGSVIKGTAATNSPMTPLIINLPATTSTDASTYPIGGTTYPTFLSYRSPATSKKGFNLLGNPYASVIDLSKVYTANNTISFYYLLIKNAVTGPNSSSTRFVLYNGLTNTAGTGGSKFVLSGQGFFVVAPSVTPLSFTFNEDMKALYSAYTNTTPPIFNVKNGGPAVLSTMAVTSNGSSLIKQAAASSAVAATKNNTNTMPWLRMDMMQDTSTFSTTDIYFDKNSKSKFVPGEDAPYLASSGQGNFFFSQTTDSIGCFANYTSNLEKLKRVNLFIAFSTFGTYKLTSPVKENIDERYTIFLKDQYTNDSLDVVHNSEYTFNVDQNPASYARNRFYLSIGIAPGHEYKLLDFNGAKITAGIQLTWKTDNESNFTKFAVEKSTNGGKSFMAIDSLLSTGEGVYTFTDKAPGAGQLTYRLVQTLVTGDTQFSKKLNFDYLNSVNPLKFIVYPTSTTQNININFGKTYSNRVKINIVSSTGSMIKTITASNTDTIQQDVGNLLKGVYIVDAIDEATGKRIGSAKFFKQ